MNARPPVTPELLSALASYARLPVPPERSDGVGALVQGVYQLVDVLDEVDLADTPPATAFDARWW